MKYVTNNMKREKVFSPARAQRMLTALALSFIIYHLSFSPARAQRAQAYIKAVDEYVPAPGQFVNTMPEYAEGDTPADMARKCTELLADGERGMVTLGAYGGYIVFHFYQPVVNLAGQKDFAVWGNAFANNAEPAIVMVAVDSNGNGLPDDQWYELRGSEYDNPATRHNYSLTYRYAPMADIAWTDNEGTTGAIGRNEYHDQEYFPLWLTGQGQLTFSGARLPDNASWNGSQFLLPAYAYGYADNQPNTLADYTTPNTEGCGMDISWAVDAEGHAVDLSYVDFVKCYNAMNQQCGWIGETSTEITGAEDLHAEASVEAYRERTTGISRPQPSALSPQPSALSPLTSLDGRRVTAPRRGLYIRNGRKIFIH